jgi:hypothetical protein
VLYAAAFVVALIHPPDAIAIAVIAALAFAVGAAIVLVTTVWNFWVLFTVGFVQPIFLGIPAAIRDFETSLGAFSLLPSLTIGGLCAAGGFLAALTHRRLSGAAFSVQVWWGWMSFFGQPLPKAELLVKAINTAAAFWGIIQVVSHLL